MKRRRLGKRGLEVSAIGFGCMGISFGWLLAQKPWIAPIPGTTKRDRLQENLGAAEVQLTADELREIDQAAAQIEVHGARYPEHLQKLVGR